LKSLTDLSRRFRGAGVRAVLAGMGAHAMQPLDAPATASFALVLGLTAHAIGWPLALGGSQSLTSALVACLEEAGGKLWLERPVQRFADLPRARAYLFDLTPKQLLAIAGDQLPRGYRDRLARFRYGPGIFKMDWALNGPIPWRERTCARSATVHLSVDLEQVAAAEAAVHRGEIAARPFIIVVQPTLFDPTRAPPERHIAWAYCHVPNGSRQDLSQQIELEIERFAPGFRERILARSTRDTAAVEAHNPNYVGGDINGGAATLAQLFTRPVPAFDPYATPNPRIFLCSSSTPPGGGVHGMCGYWAAQSALRRAFRRT